MADDFDSRTEDPTPHRREEARKQGQVAISAELSGAVVVFAGMAILTFTAHPLGQGLLDEVRQACQERWTREMDVGEAERFLSGGVQRGLMLLVGLLGFLFFAALGTGILQVGWHVMPELLGFRASRLSQGVGKMFSTSSWTKAGLLLAKVAVMGAVTTWCLWGRTAELLHCADLGVVHLAGQMWTILMRLGMVLAGTMLVWGIIDYGFQKWHHERSLRMTKQELKEELKREDGDPAIKARIRKLQRERAQNKMMREVPKATVVITNPTHLAVALRYDRTMRAPRVIAKGAGFVAKRIVETAKKHGIFVIERKPVAQALFKIVKVNQEIPFNLYYVVAEVLMYVEQLRRQAI